MLPSVAMIVSMNSNYSYRALAGGMLWRCQYFDQLYQLYIYIYTAYSDISPIIQAVLTHAPAVLMQ